MLPLLLPQAAEARRHVRAHHAAVGAAGGENDERYAALIMNPQTGEVYYSKNADAERYPASLTKMMTLYLLFEDLSAHKVAMNTRFDVSDYAATMPRTNLQLQPGDSLPVETAIKALIVLSANDAAIVVAENLDGSVGRFAERMTATAHRLGMSNTVFRNPNGLPNDEQHTTARDLAKLGIALKRDFPQYYPYFSVREFSWNGATYFTHNRVMLRYAGVDGIKTGFIGKSGFNLVTSCNRGGRPLLGVVMGGATGNWRDNRMIALLDQGYKIIATRGQQSGKIYAANLPTPRHGGPAGVPGAAPAEDAAQVADAAPAAAPAPQATPDMRSHVSVDLSPHAEEDNDTDDPDVAAEAPKQPAAPAPAPAPAKVAAPVTPPAPQLVAVKPAAIASASQPAPAAPLKPQTSPLKQVPVAQGGLTKPGASQALWGIQVGAFSTQALAEQAVQQAMSVAGPNLQGAKVSVVGDGVHRARLENVTEQQAKKACELLISQNSPCFIYRADAQNL